MALSIAEREKEGIVILNLKGRITVGEEVADFRAKMDSINEAGRERVILNLAEIEYIDSTGLGSLVICFTRMQRSGGILKLLNLSRCQVSRSYNWWPAF